ncbi:MAG: choice-of-anchor D domain-containing protein [Bacteroidetes bacterium]|nr:choice-of-anchor D domain-containing protein [Bacteroidota bacterium]
MSIASNDPDHNPWQVELKAQRDYGRLDLFSEYSVSYGTCLGDTVYYDVPVYTVGNRQPTFIKYEFVSGHNDFRLIKPNPGTVIQDYANFSVRFAPQDSAMRRGVYRFIHGNTSCPDTTLVAFSGLGQQTIVRASATTIDFGKICAGEVKDTTITLQNLGNTWASVGILEHVSGAPLFSSPDFTVFLLQDSSETYHLRFKPYAAGAFEGRYRATYGLCEDTLFFTFKGEGLETKVEFDPKSPIRIGPIFANRIAGQTVTVSNTGTTAANITRIRFSKILPPLQFSSQPKLPMLLAPGQSTTFGLRFSPTKIGDYNTSVIVEWDARCADTAAVDINAICVPNPAIEAPTSVDMGVQPCPAPLRDTIIIRNKGNGPLVFYSVSVTGPDFMHFSVIQPGPNDTAKAGSAYPMIVEFNRPTAGRSNAIIRITHNDFEAGRTDINVTAERTVSEYAVEGDSATAFFTRLFVPEVRQFTIRNIGNEQLTVTDVRVVKAGSVFSVTPQQTLPVTLQPNATTTFEVTFTPNARGPFTGVIEVESDPCTNIHVLTLTGSGDTDGLSPDRGDIDFALDPCSFTPACETVVLKNMSPEPVEVLGLSITQAGTTFSIDPAIATPFVMASNAEQTVRVCASPTVSDSEQGTLVITSNDPVYPTLSVALRAARDSSGIAVSESSIDFGRLADCMTTSPQRITITNTGDLRETVDIRFTNGGAAFSSTMTATETINPGRSFSFDVDFTRPGYGVFDDEIVLTMQRCGIEYRIPLHAELIRQEYLVAPDPLAFPVVNVGGTSTRQFTLQNNGGFNATIARIDVSPAGLFSLAGAAPSTIAAGGTENIGLRFTPTAEGDFTATVCVIVAAPCPDTICLTVEGRAVRGTLEVQPPQLVFGTKAQCELTTLFDTLRNSGSGPISIVSATITGAGAAAFTNLTPVVAPEVVNAGGIRIFEIRYDPSMAPGDGAVLAALTVRTDDGVLPQFDIPLEGGRVTLRADAGGTVDFGPVQTGNPEVRTVTLRNDGSTPLCYTTASFPAELTVLPAPPFCIDPGNTLDVQLTLTTTTSGLFSGRLALRVDAPCVDSTIFSLTARGEQGTLTQIDTIDLGVDFWCVARTTRFDIASTYLEAVVLEGVRMEGPDASFVQILSPDPSTLPRQIAPGGTENVVLTLSPEEVTRDYSATFVSTFTAFGSTIERRTVIVARRVVPSITVGTATFPVVVLGQSGGTQTITITNTSELPLPVDAASLGGPDFILRGLVPPAPATLQPGASMQASIEFIPQSLGILTDSLLVESDPCGSTLYVFSGGISGTGIAQPIVDAVLSVGDIQAEADAVIDIPIRTDSDLGVADVTGWAGSIRFNRSMLWPMEMVKEGSLSSGMQVGFTYDNVNGEVAITATGGRVASGAGVLAWLRCRVLVGNALSTPLRMSDDFGFTGGFASVAGRTDGSFELVNYCLPGERLVDVTGGLLLRQNTPNPVSLGARGTTAISYTLPDETTVSLDLYDLIGRHVRTIDEGPRAKGSHTVLADVRSLRSGTYMYVLRTTDGSAVRRMVIVP